MANYNAQTHRCCVAIVKRVRLTKHGRCNLILMRGLAQDCVALVIIPFSVKDLNTSSS